MSFTKYIKSKYSVYEKRIFKAFVVLIGKTKDKTTRNLFYIFRFALLSSIGVLLLNLILRFEFLGLGTWKLGEFGDFFGGVLNPILTFLMFLGLLITIVIQKTELALARVEYSRTANALTEQSESSKQQIIENTFFNMLKIHNENIESLKFNSSILCCAININDENTLGRAVFGSIVSWACSSKEPKKSLEQYSYLQENENHIVGHYFRGLFQILKSIDESQCSNIHKLKYARILRAQLSTNELSILFFNCISSKVDSGQFKELLIKFKMLEHISLSKRSELDYFCTSSSGGYTTKEHLLEYVIFDQDNNMTKSAFGTNPVAIRELYQL